MTKRLIDFLSSFGVMVVGLGVLGFGSVAFTHSKVEHAVARLPLTRFKVVDETQNVRVALFPVSRPAVPKVAEGAAFTKAVTASAILVVDDKTGTVLYKKNATEVRSLASITKLMTALVLLETPVRWASSTVILESDIADDSHVKVGERYTLDALWHVGLIGSSNSAIRALVRESGLTEETFVVRMNSKARELGFLSLRFVEPTGLDNRNMGTALEVSKLLKVALNNAFIKKTLAVKEYFATPLNSKEKHRVWSTNWLLTEWVPHGFIGSVVGKTGYITESGYNVAVQIVDTERHVIRVVVLGADTNEFRFSEARDIADWVFANATWPEERFATAE